MKMVNFVMPPKKGCNGETIYCTKIKYNPMTPEPKKASTFHKQPKAKCILQKDMYEKDFRIPPHNNFKRIRNETRQKR